MTSMGCFLHSKPSENTKKARLCIFTRRYKNTNSNRHHRSLVKFVFSLTLEMSSSVFNLGKHFRTSGKEISLMPDDASKYLYIISHDRPTVDSVYSEWMDGLVSICCRTTSARLNYELLLLQSFPQLSESPDCPSRRVQTPAVLWQNLRPCCGRCDAPASPVHSEDTCTVI